VRIIAAGAEGRIEFKSELSENAKMEMIVLGGTTTLVIRSTHIPIAIGGRGVVIVHVNVIVDAIGWGGWISRQPLVLSRPVRSEGSLEIQVGLRVTRVHMSRVLLTGKVSDLKITKRIFGMRGSVSIVNDVVEVESGTNGTVYGVNAGMILIHEDGTLKLEGG
jgi:hypothetical protein